MINFKKLHVDINKNIYSTGKAPHKAILVLTCIKLFENSLLDLKNIRFYDVNILETYRDIWGCLNKYDKPGPIHNPFYHLKTDGFYKMGRNIDKGPNWRPSLKQLNAIFDHAEFSDEFISIVSDPDKRKNAIEDLLQGGYFSSEEIGCLHAKLGILERSFRFEKESEKKLGDEFRVNAESGNYDAESDKQVRDISFRRIIIREYENSCAVCGLSVTCEESVSPIDAAHILPHSKFHNDDPRNGIALCKFHHWAFDNFLLSVSPDYLIKISNSIINEQPERILSELMRKKIILPDDELYYPAKSALEWHNRNRFNS